MANGQTCFNSAGSLNYDNLRVATDLTFIFADSEYKVVCEGTVIAWEFCYIEENKASVIFYPGIWMPNDHGASKYILIRSSNVSFTLTRVRNNDNNGVSCQTFYLSTADQFIAPAGSVVGLYSNTREMRSSLLRTNSMGQSITTYQFFGNKSDVNVSDVFVNIIRYNIALRVHLAIGEYNKI